MKNEIPENYTKLVGTKQTFSGGLFSSNKAIDPTEFNVLDIRWGDAVIMDIKARKEKHPTVEYLVKREGMRASRWTKPFAVREINLNNN